MVFEIIQDLVCEEKDFKFTSGINREQRKEYTFFFYMGKMHFLFLAPVSTLTAKAWNYMTFMPIMTVCKLLTSTYIYVCFYQWYRNTLGS